MVVKIHEKCDNVGPTIIIIKIRDNNCLVGYNSLGMFLVLVLTNLWVNIDPKILGHTIRKCYQFSIMNSGVFYWKDWEGFLYKENNLVVVMTYGNGILISVDSITLR